MRNRGSVLAVAEVGGGDDAEGADGGERANPRSLTSLSHAQTRSRSGPRGSSRPRVNTSRVQPLAFARVG